MNAATVSTGQSVGVRLQNISKTFPGGTQAVDDLSLEIYPGEVFTLLGPSGCGKTTTLRMVAGLEAPDIDGGTIAFGDRPIVDSTRKLFVPPEKRQVGMVFQSYAIWPHMTVEQNVAYPLRLRKMSRTESRQRVANALELVGLEGMEKRPAPMLSGGQQQRVALARALVYEPEILLLDEPFSNLDAKLREQMRLEVKLLQKKLQITVLFVTHDQVEALSLSDRIAVMDFGRVQQVGVPKELYESPANAFVRDFLGKTLLLTGVIQSSNQEGQVAVALDGAPNCVLFGRTSQAQDVAPGVAVNIAVRPEDVDLMDPEGDELPQGVIGGKVRTTLFTGDRTEYQVEVEGQGTLLLYGTRQHIFGEGSPLWLKMQPETISVWPV
ncbi:MAG: ABC transporter ATP-binding protein [Chloroflexota bacterium]|nr:ABC transporter ATP-binding protein [Chloroflexota bacterium]MDE2884849.1 ABC transporter ATP-binding protein [Chloroflexota bacterium]